MALVLTENVPLTIEAVGNVRASASVAVRSQVVGSIVQRLVESGGRVQKGDILYRLDPRPFELVILQERANLEREKVALTKAEDDMRRYKNLIERSAVSREQYDQARTDAQSLKASVAMRQATLEQAELQLEYSIIKAPISGVAGEAVLDVGTLVKALDDNSVLLTINTIVPADVFFAVPENRLPEIMEKMRQGELSVLAAPEGYNGPSIKGRLTAVNNTVDQSTGTISLKASFENKDEKLWPGQFVRVELLLDELPEAVVVPLKAVQEGASGKFVYVVNADNSVESRPVNIRFLSHGNALVLDGLKGGEQVVLEGQLNLRPGAKVEIKNVPEAKELQHSQGGGEGGGVKSGQSDAGVKTEAKAGARP